jgi:hypothetical protein
MKPDDKLFTPAAVEIWHGENISASTPHQRKP